MNSGVLILVFWSPKNPLIVQIEKRTWKLCETTGEIPKPRNGAKSFVIDGKLFIYGVCSQKCETDASYKELFELNLSKINTLKVPSKFF